jgi:hypothetical protein
MQPPLAVWQSRAATVSIGANVGRTWLDATRGIDRCVDCSTDDVRLNAGNYVEAGLQATTRSRWGLGARYRMYAGDSDLNGMVVIGATVVR